MVGPALQVRFPTSLTDEEYVSQRAWNLATAPDCPWCRPGTCELAPHGFYARVQPAGTRVRRFRCPRQGRTVSLLPDCLSVRVTGSLEALEAAVRVAEGAASRGAAVEQARAAVDTQVTLDAAFRRACYSRLADGSVPPPA